MVNKIVLDLQGFTSEWNLHEYMQKRFDIPVYHGHNPDALWDAVYLWFKEPTVIEVKNLDKLPANMKSVGGSVAGGFSRAGSRRPLLAGRVQMINL